MKMKEIFCTLANRASANARQQFAHTTACCYLIAVVKEHRE